MAIIHRSVKRVTPHRSRITAQGEKEITGFSICLPKAVYTAMGIKKGTLVALTLKTDNVLYVSLEGQA